MNTNNIFSNSQNPLSLPKNSLENNSFPVPNPQETKIISSIPDHNINFPFKVIQKEKDSNIPNNFLFLNNDKGAKNSAKNINIIKPKFVTKTIANEVSKIKNMDETPSLNLSLNLSSSAFQPQIIKDNKEFRTKVNNKIFNLILNNKKDIFKLELHQIIDDVYLLKYFYENNFSLADLKLLNKFFCLFDNIADMMKELEKWLMKNQYTVLEDLDNKIAKIQIKVPILQMYENVELTLTQKQYSKENLFEILCKKVANISQEYENRMGKLEKENKFLLINLFHLTNSLNPMNMNYPINQRENIININNINSNQNKNINNMNRLFRNNNSNNNINKNTTLIKGLHHYSNTNINKEVNNKHSNLNYKEYKYDENKENNINYEAQNEASNESNSISDNHYFKIEKKEKNIRLNKKRGRTRKLSYSSNKNNSGVINKNIINNNSNEIQETNNNNNTNIMKNNNIELNYYVLKDIKAKKINKVKGLYDIINSPDELLMIMNKILYKYYKYKKNGNINNYENKLSFCLINLFDSDTFGDSASAFHKNCDYKFNTISVVETSSGHRFGGYTSECFESPNEYFDKKDNLSFVFSLDKQKTYDVIKGKYAISCDKNYGPYFRDDHICIVDEFFTKESGTCIKGKGFNTSKNYELNSGKKYFTVKRLQVFQIKIKRIK